MFNLKYIEYQEIIKSLDNLDLNIPDLIKSNKKVMSAILDIIKYGKLKGENYISKSPKNNDLFILSNMELEKNLNIFCEILIKKHNILNFQIYNSYSDPLVDLDLLKDSIKIKQKNSRFNIKNLINEYHLNKDFYTNQIIDIMNIKSKSSRSFNKKLNLKEKNTIDKYKLNLQLLESFTNKFNSEIEKYIHVMFNESMNQKEKIEEIKKSLKILS